MRPQPSCWRGREMYRELSKCYYRFELITHHTSLQQTPKLGKWIHVSLKCLLAALNGIFSIMTEIQ